MEVDFWEGLRSEELQDITIASYARTMRRSAKEGFDHEAFQRGAAEAWQAGQDWIHSRRSARPCGRRNDIHFLNAYARVAYRKGWHDHLLKWQPVRPTPTGKLALGAEDIERVLEAAKAAGPRDHALLEVALLTGASRTELSKLTVQDLDWARSRIYIHGSKGHATSWVPVEVDLFRPGGPLALYVAKRRAPVDNPDALWVGERKPYRALQAPGIYQAIRAIGQAAGMDLCPSVTRKTRGRRLWKNGWPEELIQLMLRHRSRTSTPIYTTPGFDDIEERMGAAGGPGLNGLPRRSGCPTCGQAWPGVSAPKPSLHPRLDSFPVRDL